MKKFLKNFSVCIGLPIINILIAMVVQAIAIGFFRDINKVNENIYILTFIADVIMLGLIYIIFLMSKEGMLKRITFKKIKLKEFLYVLLFGIGLSIMLLFLTALLSQLIPSYQNVANQMISSKNSILQLIIMIVLIPIYEELFFRGIIFGYLKRSYNIIIAILVQALVFGVMHLNIVQGIYTFILGIALALVYMYCESIVGNIVLHIVFNLLGILVIPKLTVLYPNITIILLVIAVILLVFSIFKMLGKYEDKLFN